MSFTEAGVFPVDFIYLGIFYALAVFGLSLRISTGDIRRMFTQRKELWCCLAAQHLILPILVMLGALVLFLPMGVASGLVLIACLPAMTTSGILVWFARGDVALALTLVVLSCLVSTVQVPVVMELWVNMHPQAAQNASMIGYSPWYAVSVGIGVVALPALAGIAVARFLPAAAKATPYLAGGGLLAILLMPLGMMYSNTDIMFGNLWNIGLAVALVFLGCLAFLIYLGHALRLRSGAAAVLALSAPARNIAIAGLFGLQGLGLATDLAPTILWWGTLQIYGGFAAACYLRRISSGD